MQTVKGPARLPEFDADGLVPVIVQDKNTGRVLMLAYANLEAYTKTLTSRYAHFFSRSRKRIWKKGEESVNVMLVEDVQRDCDGDALLYVVIPSGPACHTGAASCFS